jgi:hypothetical protein
MSTTVFAGAGTTFAAGAEPVWIVPLGDHADYYDQVRLRRVFFDEHDACHCVVIVDTCKLLRCADRDRTDYVLPPVGQWHSGKICGIRAFLDPAGDQIPTMPHVTIGTRRAPGLRGWLGLDRIGVVAFLNGQHRARYLAHAGAQTIPVEVHEREAGLLKAMCGA